MADDISIVIGVDSAPVDRAVRVMDNLEAEVRDVERAFKSGLITEKQYNAETKRLTQSMGRLKTVAKGSARDFRAFEKTVYGSGKAMRQKEIAMQQAGYQLQDFIVQVQAGTNPLIAFSQQGSQLAGFFAGPWGAAIGLGIAALGGLGTALFGAYNKSKTLYEESENLLELMGNYEGAFDSANEGILTLEEAFGRLTESVRTARQAILELRQAELEQQLGTVFGQFSDKYVQTGGGDRRAMMAEMFGLKMTTKGFKDPEGNLRGGQIGELMSFMTGAQFAETNEQRLDYLSRALDIAKELSLVTGGLSEEEQELVNTIQNIYQTFENAVAKTAQTTREEAKKVSDFGIGAFGGKGASNEQLQASVKITNDIVQQQLQIERDANTVRASLHSAFTMQRIADEKKLEQIGINRMVAAKAMEAAAMEATKQRADEEYGAYQRNIDERYKGEAALFDQAVKISDDLLEKIEEDAEKAARAYENAFNATSFLFANRFSDETALMGMPVSIDPDNKPDDKKKGPKKTTIEDTIKNYRRQMATEQALMNLTGQRRREEELFLDLKYANQDADIKTSEARLRSIAEEMAAVEERSRVIEEARRQQQELTDFIGGSFENAMMSIVDGTKSVEDAFRTMAAEIIKELYRVLVVKKMVAAATSFFGFADGGVFSNGNVVPFANGGVVGGPTVFPMAGGKTGLMGEAGPEAIMPLKRGKDGKLGVSVDGQSDTVVVNNHFNFAANGDDSVKRIIVQSMPQITEAAKAGVLDARKRGGSFRKVFS